MPGHVFIENTDLVFETEKNRVNTLDDSSKNNNYSQSGVVSNTSALFKTNRTSVDDNDTSYKIRFISIDNQYPNSELREMITSGIWFDDYNFIYSIKNRGIYVYNAKDRVYKTLKTGEGDFRLTSVYGNYLNYDRTSMEVNLD